MSNIGEDVVDTLRQLRRQPSASLIVVLTLGGAAVVAAYVPAQRAIAIEPSQALRYD
jgi:ABC-type lipoprotein release transport system permease subunit